MPHSKNDTGSYDIRVTARAVDSPSASYTESFTVGVTDTYNVAFKTTPYRATVRVGDSITHALPSILNQNGMEYRLELTSAPDWVSYSESAKAFTFRPDLEKFLDGELSTGSFEIKMEWNAKSSQEYVGAYLAVASLEPKKQSTGEFYQWYVLDVDLVEMPADLSGQITGVRNLTEYIEVVLEWAQPVEYRDSLIMSRRLQGHSSLLGDLITFEMKTGSTLELPDIQVMRYDENGLVLAVSKPDGGEYTPEETVGQVVLMTLHESYDISSYKSPKSKLQA